MPRLTDDAPVDFTTAASSSRATTSGTIAVAAEAIHSRRPQRNAAPVYGRRAAGYVQLNLTVAPHIKRRLRAQAEAHGVTMGELLEELLDRQLPQ